MAHAKDHALAAHPYAAFLARMKKPGRYLGGEEQAIVKDHADLACLERADLAEVRCEDGQLLHVEDGAGGHQANVVFGL